MKKSMKRFIAVICVAVMLVGVMSVANLKQVNATEATEEKTVFAEEVTSGTVTPGNGNTEQCSEEGYVFGGYYDDYNTDTKKFSNPITEERDASQDSVFIRWVPEEVMTVKAQVREDEYKEVLTNCDSKDSDSNIYEGDRTTSGKICSDKNYVLEGVGSLQSTVTPSVNNTTYYNIYLNDSINVLGYKYFSCKLYLSTVDEFPSKGTTLIIGIKNSYGSINNDCLQFYVDTSDLKEGWNDLKLPFASAEIIRNGETDKGRWDGSVKYIRILQLEGKENAGELTTYLDDVCVLNDSEGILVADCDQLDSPNSTGAQKEDTLVNISSESTSYSGTLTLTDTAKEGTKAVKTTAYEYKEGEYRLETKFKLGASNKLNIVSYQETGSLHLWLYIPDTTKLQGDFNIFLTSGTAITDKAIYFTIDAADLKDEWNEITLPFSEATPNGSNAMDWTSVQYIMIRTRKAATKETYQDMYMIIDDIRVVNRVQALACDSNAEITDGSSAGSLVTEGQKQGDGAFKKNVQNTAKVLFKLNLSEAVDFSSFRDNGCLHFWLYIENKSNVVDDVLKVELGSDGNSTASANKKTYEISKSNLIAGWNEIFVYLGDDTYSDIGTLSWNAINYIRIVDNSGGSRGHSFLSMIDDISLVPGNSKKLNVRFISTVDSLEYQSVGYEITQSRSQNPLVTETTNVYKNIWASNKNGVLDNVKPSDVSGVNCSTYMHLATLVNIPARLWDATFTVTPYWKTQDGTTVKGAAQPYTMNKLMSITKQAQEDTDFRVIVTSDVHYTNQNGDVYGYGADERMQLWMDSILNEHETNPIDLLIINGDESLDYRAVDGGSMLKENISETKAFVETYVSQLRKKMPVVILPGNHEQYNDEQWMEITGNHRNETYVLGNNLFIMPDSYGSNLNPTEASDGTYSAFDMDYINKTILQFPEHKVYIVSHYLNMSKQNAEFLNLLQTNENIVGLFSGHTHSALTLGGENDATYGRKTVAQTGHFSWTQGEDTTFWGFRDLTITSDSSTCKYISVPATVTVEGQQTTYERTESNVIVYYSSEQ